MRAFLDRLAAWWRPRDTFGARITIALCICALISVVATALIGYLTAVRIAEEKEVESMQAGLTELADGTIEVVDSFARFVADLAGAETVAATLVDTKGRERYLGSFLQLVQSSLKRQFDPVKTGLEGAGISILDFRGEMLASSDRSDVASYRGRAWVDNVMAGQPQAVYLENTRVLLVAYPITFPGTGQPEGIALGRVKVGGLARNKANARWIAAVGGDGTIGTLVADPALRVLSAPLKLRAPLHQMGWKAALGYPRERLVAEGRRLIWIYAVAVLFALPLIGVFGYLLGRRIGLPVARLSRQAQQFALAPAGAGGLPDFSAMGGTTEIATLANSLRMALASVQEGSEQMRLAQAALDSSREGIVIADASQPDLPMIYVNDAFVKITGYERAESMGRNCRFLHRGAGDQPGLTPVREALARGEPGSAVLRNYRRDGSLFWNELSIAPVKDATGRVTHFIGIQRDVTARLHNEEQLRHLQKTEAIGQLTGGLAHDFNNLLGIILGNLDLIEESLPKDDKTQRRFRAALDASVRGAEVTRSLMAVARRQPMEVGSYDLNQLVQEMLALLQTSAGSAVQISWEPAPGVLPARLDAGGLSNVALNLVINARDAMKEVARDRRITLRTSRVVIPPGEPAGMLPGEYAVLEVIDTGTGMSDEVRLRAFEPFFTTKERDKGTGLGLAMVHGYAEQLGGTARIERSDETGTAVSLYLPLAEGLPGEAGERADDPVAPGEAASQQARVLVVDDEVGLCDLACNWLSSLGLQATGVHDARSALEKLGEGPQFDLLFTDVVMPGGMDGIALAREALRRQPGLSVLLASGYAEALLDDKAPPGPLLSKPYRKEALSRAVQQALKRS